MNVCLQIMKSFHELLLKAQKQTRTVIGGGIGQLVPPGTEETSRGRNWSEWSEWPLAKGRRVLPLGGAGSRQKWGWKTWHLAILGGAAGFWSGNLYCVTKGPILSRFPALMEPQCSPKIRVQPLPRGGLCNCPSTTRCGTHPLAWGEGSCPWMVAAGKAPLLPPWTLGWDKWTWHIWHTKESIII